MRAFSNLGEYQFSVQKMKFSAILVVVNGNFFCDLSNGILVFSVLFVMAFITVKVLF